ncbi:hypothetical protein [Corallococcus exiguus]|uniref:hypothetical protein n=1 Tax=Corallococcus exiguus TaxID=83462 RepID=UPI00149494FC|nr:hypothetical protein [Corallococcus exiguus]NPD27997.1 hypothetical protein [Corallococcus exiguus]
MSHFYHQTFTARDIAALSEHDQALLDASALWSYGRLFAPGDSIVSIAMHIFELVSHPVATNCRNCHQRAGWPRAHMGRTPFAAYQVEPIKDDPGLLANLQPDNPILKGLLLLDFQWALSDRAIPLPPLALAAAS